MNPSIGWPYKGRAELVPASRSWVTDYNRAGMAIIDVKVSWFDIPRYNVMPLTKHKIAILTSPKCL